MDDASNREVGIMRIQIAGSYCTVLDPARSVGRLDCGGGTSSRSPPDLITVLFVIGSSELAFRRLHICNDTSTSATPYLVYWWKTK